MHWSSRHRTVMDDANDAVSSILSGTSKGSRLVGFSAGIPAKLIIVENDGRIISNRVIDTRIFGGENLPNGQTVICLEVLESVAAHPTTVERGEGDIESSKIGKGGSSDGAVATADNLPAAKNSGSSATLGNGRLIVNFDRRTVEADGKRARLAESEFDLVEILARRPDVRIGEGQLAKATGLATSTVRAYVRYARDKIEKAASGAGQTIAWGKMFERPVYWTKA